VAVNASHLKTGSGCRGERIEKFNQLMRIEHELGKSAFMGYMYDFSLYGVIIFSVLTQLIAAAIIFVLIQKSSRLSGI
jgi:hypothetical protein